MIFFIAPNPNTDKREGFLQRVFAIDSLFVNEEKKYIDGCKSEAEVIKSLIEAEVIYIHSVYQASRVAKYIEYFADKVIIDLHGVVPEELEYMGDSVASKAMSEVELTVFKHVKYYVAVTDVMVAYYQKKYKKVLNHDAEWVTLPIFDQKDSEVGPTRSYKKLNIIYAGGTQKWQSVEKMIALMDRMKDSKRFSFIILSPDTEVFSRVRLHHNTSIMSASPSVVKDYYGKSTLGLILRDHSIVNRVACPTKLIEYFEYGIVPVVDSEQIGDFKELGYKYVKYDELDESLDSIRLESIAKHNHSVVEKLRRKSNKGKTQLSTIVNDIKLNKQSNQQLESLLEQYAHITDRVEELERENELQRLELEKTVTNYRTVKNELDAIKNSKKWQLITKTAKIIGK